MYYNPNHRTVKMRVSQSSVVLMQTVWPSIIRQPVNVTRNSLVIQKTCFAVANPSFQNVLPIPTAAPMKCVNSTNTA